MRLRWTRRALRDLADLQAWIAQDRPTAARRQAGLIVDAVEKLSEFPAAGRAGRLADTRELVVPGTQYIVAYRAGDIAIEVLAVVHGRRRWPTRL